MTTHLFDAAGTDLVHRCQQFVLHETDLVDLRELDDWLNLFADDAVYWLPMSASRDEPGDGLNLIYDDLPRLRDRVSRLQSGLAFSDEPHSTTSHALSPVRVLAGGPHRVAGRAAGRGEHVVVGRAVVGRARRGDTDTFHARFTWLLREVGDTLRIVVKRVDLLGANEPLPVLTFLL